MKKLLKTPQKPHKAALFCILFVSYVHQNYIQEDWEIYNRLGKLCVYPAWFIYSCLIWLICPIFLPEYLFKQTSIYREIQKLQSEQQKLKSLKFR